VRVEDIEQAQLLVELDHRADVDVQTAKAVGLGPHVFDVDRRDAALFRITLGDRDLHASALHLRPAAVGVEVRLGETELAGVEAARVVDAADAVPDPGRHEDDVTARGPATPRSP